MATVSLFSLPPEIHTLIFRELPDLNSLLATIQTCKGLYSSFQSAHQESILEDIRFQEIGCGAYAEALLYSLRLMEPDIRVEHVYSWAAAFKSGDWNLFLESLPNERNSKPWTTWQAAGFYSETSFCYYNQHPSKGEELFAGGDDRWGKNYRLARVLARQCCATKLRQGFGSNGVDDYSRIHDFKDNPLRVPPPPTENELRRFEKGAYALWIMINIGALIHRPDFLSNIEEQERFQVQRELRRAVVGTLDVWDWRGAQIMREYMVARLAHIDMRFRAWIFYRSRDDMDDFDQEGGDDMVPHSDDVIGMWKDVLPDRFKNWEHCDRVIDSAMVAFSPPGALRYFFPDRILTEAYRYGAAARDSALFRRVVEREVRLRPGRHPQNYTHAELALVENAISGFADMSDFFLRIWGSWGPACEPWDDIYIFYPQDRYPDRSELPLEAPRALIPPWRGVVHYGPPGGSVLEDVHPGALGLCEDSGWAWTNCTHLDECMWDDWRLMEYGKYDKPKIRRRKRDKINRAALAKALKNL